ncbi:MAG TPA: MBOAT family protein [Solimonas sp.]|nr:MBOAT family protein [Solimonas sp.]
MLFNSYEFVLVFLPLTFLGYWLLSSIGRTTALWWLALASLFFYSWWNPVYLPLLLASLLFNYVVGLRLSQGGTGTRKLLIFGIAVDLALLFYYKYSFFVVSTVEMALDLGFRPHPIILPLAISFYTFQKIGYLVDSWRGQTRDYRFTHYLLFVTFFPQLIAGPIVHHKEVVPQFLKGDRFRPQARQLAIGLTIFTIGLFKKVVLADGIAVYANAIFHEAASGRPLDFFLAWCGSLTYTLQLYFDFSGYSDMAIGLGWLFGVRLPINFDSPFRSSSLAEFWRRWHITLSRFLKQYVYIPLGGSRVGETRAYLNVFLTMFLSGIWHGAGWTYLVWGIYNGVIVVFNRAWERLRKRLGWAQPRAWWDRGVAVALTLVAWTAGLTIFRADSMATANNILAGMAGLHGAVLPQHWQAALAPFAAVFDALHIGFVNAPIMLTYKVIAWIAVLGTITLALPNIYQWLDHEQPVLREQRFEAPPARQWRPSLMWVLLVMTLAAGALLSMSQVSEFLYFQF